MTPTFNGPVIEASILPFVIQTEEQYNKALVITESLFFKPQKTLLEDQILEVWTVLVEIYEQKHFAPGQSSTPASMLHSLMEAQGLIQADLVRAGIGSSGVVSELVNCKREISKQQAKKLAELFHVSPELFL